MKLAAVLFLASLTAFAQTPTGAKSRGIVYAGDYDYQPIRVFQGNSATGSQSINLVTGIITLPDGRTISPFATNVPITIGGGAEQETVTPSAVSNCGLGQPIGSCTITATFSQIHSTASLVKSGDNGLQEALNDAALLHAVVIDENGNTTFTNQPWTDVMGAGAKCDDSTDDTAVISAALTALLNHGGGTLMIPPGKFCKIASQLTLPNDGQSIPHQASIRITSWGNPSANGTWGSMGVSGGLDLTFNASVAKIITLGLGKLEIDHLALKDSGSDCAPFLLTTNTTLLFHDNTVSGTGNGASACNDVLILGGTSATVGGTVSNQFQGYGTVVARNWFDQIKRMALLQSAANNIIFRDNTLSVSCGFTTGAAFEINGPNSNPTGNLFEGNLIEVRNYKYAFNIQGAATRNVFIANGAYDPNGTTTSVFNFASTTNINQVIAGFYANGSISLTTDAATGNVYTDPVQGVLVNKEDLLGLNFVPIGITDGSTKSYQMFAGWPGQFDGTWQFYQSALNFTGQTFLGGVTAAKDFVWGGTGPGVSNTTKLSGCCGVFTNTVANIAGGGIWISNTAPTISSGFGTSPSIVANNGTAAFTLNVGTGGTATTGVIGLPASNTGWNCFATDRNSNIVTRETATTTNSATLTAASAWTASDILQVSCFGY